MQEPLLAACCLLSPLVAIQIVQNIPESLIAVHYERFHHNSYTLEMCLYRYSISDNHIAKMSENVTTAQDYLIRIRMNEIYVESWSRWNNCLWNGWIDVYWMIQTVSGLNKKRVRQPFIKAVRIRPSIAHLIDTTSYDSRILSTSHITETAIKHLIGFSMENNNLWPWVAK